MLIIFLTICGILTLLFIKSFIVIPYLKLKPYKNRKGILTYFFPVFGVIKFKVKDADEDPRLLCKIQAAS